MRVDVKQGPFVPEPEDVATSGASPGRNDRVRADTLEYEPSASPWPEDGARTPALPVDTSRERTLVYQPMAPQREERAVTLQYVSAEARAATPEDVPVRAATPEYEPEIEDDIQRAPRRSTRVARTVTPVASGGTRVARRLHPYQ